MEKAKQFFEKQFGQPLISFKEIPQSGSSRKNYVATTTIGQFIVTYNENRKENESFFYFSSVFSELELPTPRVLKISEDRLYYVQDFLGEETLSQIIEAEKQSNRTENLVKKSLEQLFSLQNKTEGKVDFSKSFEYESYDELPIVHDLYYFKNYLVDVLEIPYHKSTLLKEFKKISESIENIGPKGIMIRDFQSRNILVNHHDDVFFIDYQSAMEGPLMYDVVSFLYQAKANFTSEFKEKMLQFYYGLWEDEKKKNELKNSLKILQLIRFLQVLGAYGFRGLIQKKSHFISSISKGIENLYGLSVSWEGMNEFPELKNVIKELTTEETKNKIEDLIFD